MTDAERESREAFYQNLVWVIDGTPFRKNFDIYHMLPDPASELAQDPVWAKAARHADGANCGIFFRVSVNQEHYQGVTKARLRGGRAVCPPIGLFSREALPLGKGARDPACLAARHPLAPRLCRRHRGVARHRPYRAQVQQSARDRVGGGNAGRGVQRRRNRVCWPFYGPGMMPSHAPL